jgi:4-hydroxy-tetrahydrodipicolinate synthase
MKLLPKGMFTALATPFNEDESINFEALKKLIDFQVENKMHGLLIGGSTGEYHTMNVEERKQVIKASCEYAAGRIPIVAGISASRPSEVIDLGNFAAECGAEWGLVLPPFYHQTTRQGIIDYFKEIAAATKVGIVMYNYPSGTGIQLDTEMIAELAKEPNIVGLKDTNADMDQTAKAIAATRDLEFSVLQGFEHLMIPCFALGGAGAFGIIHNLLPKEMVELYETFMDGDWKAECELNAKLTNLYNYMELEPFPGPVKAALNLMGFYGGVLRKPLTQTSKELTEKVVGELKKFGVSISESN